MGNAKFKMQNSNGPRGPALVLFLHFSFCIVNYAPGEAQVGSQLIDRVVARVDGNAITLTDVQAAVGLGLVEPRAGVDAETAAREELIERDLLLAEIARFPPPEPDAAAIEKEVATLEANAGRRLESLMQSTGLDPRRIREIARDTLRIQAYVNQRFGGAAAVGEDEARQYYDAHPAEFTRNGSPQAFSDVQDDARQRAAAERRRTLVTQWLRDLRARADVVVTKPGVK
jgi:hypothetical protein